MDRRVQTVDDVCALLTQLFRGKGLFPATRDYVESQLNWRRRFLATDEEAWRALMFRAQWKAEGVAAHERALSRGWSPSGFERAWRRGACAILMGLQTERINDAALDASLDADERLTEQGRIEPVIGSGPLYRLT